MNNNLTIGYIKIQKRDTFYRRLRVQFPDIAQSTIDVTLNDPNFSA